MRLRTRPLEDTHDRLRMALRAASAAAWEWDLQTHEFTWSAEGHRLYGFADAAPPDFLAWRERIHPDDRQVAAEAFDAVVEGARDQYPLACRRVEVLSTMPSARLRDCLRALIQRLGSSASGRKQSVRTTAIGQLLSFVDFGPMTALQRLLPSKWALQVHAIGQEPTFATVGCRRRGRRSKRPAASQRTTSSARNKRLLGTATPSATAVFRLISSSNLSGCWTARSPGLAPLKIRST